MTSPNICWLYSISQKKYKSDRFLLAWSYLAHMRAGFRELENFCKPSLYLPVVFASGSITTNAESAQPN